MDAGLVAKAQRGDPAAFDALVLRHQDRVYAVCLRTLNHAEAARDAAQEAFVKAWKALPRFEGRAQFGTWVYRIAINVSLSARRSLKARPDSRAASLDAPADGGAEEGRRVAEPAAPDAPPGADLERREARTAVAAAIAELPDDFRTPVILRDIEGKSYEEIAAILQVPVGTVRSRIHRGREHLRQLLEGFVAGKRGAAPKGVERT